jgi:hypothetical protein
MAAVLAASACGDSSGDVTKTEILSTGGPPGSYVYFQIKGPAGAVSYIGDRIAKGGFANFGEGFLLPPPKKDCEYVHTISRRDSPHLQAWEGRRVTIHVYGKYRYAGLLYCRLTLGVIFR